MNKPDLRYPIGRYERRSHISGDERKALVERIRLLPVRLREAVAGLDSAQLETPYRDGGWTVRQVVHHVGDSHINFLVRCKLGLTEHRPMVRPYDENAWVNTGDARSQTTQQALDFVQALHERIHAVVSSLNDELGARIIVHPDTGESSLDQLIDLYAWHGDHHVAHITALRERMGW